jgi:hypothetical protein
MGLSGEVSGPNGFGGAVHITVLQRLYRALETGSIEERHLRRFLGSFEALDGLRFEALRGELANAVLTETKPVPVVGKAQVVALAAGGARRIFTCPGGRGRR